jgi:hypothetical protein
MAILEVTSRQFRDKQKNFFDLADAGKQIIIRRRRKQAYTLTPINDEDLYFTPEMIEKIDRAIEQIKNGEYTEIKNKEELRNYFDNL